MKALTCEMCGSTDMIKQDGAFVCQSCGMKYSVEEAKKMMIEGTVNVQGTVKIDNSGNVEKHLQNARRAKKKEDWEEVEKYYNLVEQDAPDNIEAVFYSAYGKVMASLMDEDRYKKEQKCDMLCKIISGLDDYYDPEQGNELIPLIQQIGADVIALTCSSFVYKKRQPPEISDDYYIYQKFLLVELRFMECLEKIIKKDDNVKLYRVLIDQMHNWWRLRNHPGDYLTKEEKVYLNAKFNRMREINEKISAADPTYIPRQVPANFNEGGCYVATAVYGSYDCPQVWTLRRFRDDTLAATWYGRAFIRTYYAISPTLVKWFGNTNWFKKMWRGTLDRMVRNLRAKGVEATPYEDRNW